MKRRSFDRAALAKLNDRILELLAQGEESAEGIARATGFSGSTIRTRLSQLRLEGEVSYVKDPEPKLGARFIWRLGQDESVKAGGAQPGGPGAVYQVTVKTYPVENRRDPLVAALFGAPRQIVRSVSCRVEQGHGHAAGCMFAQAAA